MISVGLQMKITFTDVTFPTISFINIQIIYKDLSVVCVTAYPQADRAKEDKQYSHIEQFSAV